MFKDLIEYCTVKQNYDPNVKNIFARTTQYVMQLHNHE